MPATRIDVAKVRGRGGRERFGVARGQLARASCQLDGDGRVAGRVLSMSSTRFVRVESCGASESVAEYKRLCIARRGLYCRRLSSATARSLAQTGSLLLSSRSLRFSAPNETSETRARGHGHAHCTGVSYISSGSQHGLIRIADGASMPAGRPSRLRNPSSRRRTPSRSRRSSPAARSLSSDPSTPTSLTSSRSARQRSCRSGRESWDGRSGKSARRGSRRHRTRAPRQKRS